MINSLDHLNKVLRIAFGASLGLIICKVADLDSWGVFYTIVPILLLGLVPRINRFVALQALASPLFGAVVLFGYNLCDNHPFLATPLIFMVFLFTFYCMAKGPLFLFGAMSTINNSVFLHFASYPDADFSVMSWANVLSTVIGLAICALVLWWFPVHQAPAAPPRIAKPTHQVIHQTLLGASVATTSFVLFQIADLRDSLSAQATSVLILFPMTLSGVLDSGMKRAKGVMLGSSYAIVAQLLLYTYYQNLTLSVLVFFIGLLLFARVQHLEGPGSGVAFGGMTTLGIIFGQYLKADQDLIYSALYRISSVTVAVLLTLTAVYFFHSLLNRFQTTRYVVN
ncbi:1,4-alpha-glucan branching protein [Pokkaliibacter plantistimulans]|uniref:1,4-alpha-glucan branching protein n=1 Tax=Proteobacteria bacterium 228 TaxID=2083153 RepID=A0A2S5KV53_9PROT|nr:DUF2955 domain-containing protein [Pokkaliibacter plantistimulans]PPC78598.1 1,4-alpha-glucan branching protein [Pokkaliibacter plantistimulans]